MSEPTERLLKIFLNANLDVFAWKHNHIVGIDPKITSHVLKLDPKIKTKIQRCQSMLKKYETLKNEVDKLLENGFYP